VGAGAGGIDPLRQTTRWLAEVAKHIENQAAGR